MYHGYLVADWMTSSLQDFGHMWLSTLSCMTYSSPAHWCCFVH